MGRIGIAFEEVKAAIAELQGKQKNPTVDAIREILGTGSKSTIARYLREWKSKRGLHSDDDGRLPSDLLSIVHGLWDALCNKADQQTDEYRQESAIQMANLQQQVTNARQLEANLQQNAHQLEEQLHQQKGEAQQFKAQWLTESQERIKMTERAAALESRCHENQAENQRLHQLLKQVQENLEHYQTATQELRQEQSLVIEKRQNEYEQKLSSLLVQTNIATNEKSACLAQHHQLTQMHESLVTEHKALAIRYGGEHEQHAFLKLVHEKTQHDHEALKNQSQAQLSELAALQRATMELQFNIKSKDEKITSLENLMVKANDKIETLRNESQFVLQEKSALEWQFKQILASDKALTVG